jgi:hypothetical protein
MVNVLNFMVKYLYGIALKSKADGLDIYGTTIVPHAALYILRESLPTRCVLGACQLCDTEQRCMEVQQKTFGLFLRVPSLAILRMSQPRKLLALCHGCCLIPYNSI